jgi:hypothetical protein
LFELTIGKARSWVRCSDMGTQKARTDNIAHFRTTLLENNWPLPEGNGKL